MKILLLFHQGEDNRSGDNCHGNDICFSLFPRGKAMPRHADPAGKQRGESLAVTRQLGRGTGVGDMFEMPLGITWINKERPEPKMYV